MNKYKTSKFVISTIFLTILTISLIVGCISPVRADSDGFTILSIDSTPITSNSDLNKANFTLHLVANGGGQSVVGNFGNKTFLDYITNVIIRDPLKIEIGNVKEKLTHPILNQGQLFKYEYHYIERTDFWNSVKCDGSTFCFPVDAWNRILAINKVPIGMYGALGKPDMSWSGEMTVTINGFANSKNIGSGEDASGSVNFESVTGEWIAHAVWIGSLITGQSTPQESLFIPTYKTENKQWKIAPKTYYDTYTKSLSETDIALNTWKSQNYEQLGKELFDRTKIPVCIDFECSNVLNLITIHNINLDALTNANTQISYASVTATSSTIITKKQSDTMAGSVVDVIDRKIANPEIVMVVKASTLNPYIPVGFPQIESVTAEPFNSGDGKADAYIKIKNIGEATGTFSARLTDESNTFTSQSNVESAKITLPKGETGTIVMHINYGENLQDITKTGLITVYEVNSPNSNATTTKDFIINMKSAKVCQPSEYRVYNNEVYKCNDDGTDETKILSCNGLIRQVDGKYICEEINGKSNSNIKEELTTSGKKEVEKDKPKEGNSIFVNALYWLAAFLILTGIFIFVNKIRNNESKITKENIDKSLLLSGAVTGLVFLYIQYAALSEALGLVLWIIVVISIIITLIANIISILTNERIFPLKLLPLKVSIAIVIASFIIIIMIATGIKGLLCGNPSTSWIFGNCKEFNLMNYLLK